jgi:hypothetical protein
MRKKSLMILAIVCALALSALVTPTPARAQDATHYTFVSFWAVPRAQWSEFEKSQVDTTSILEKMVADGSLVGWGAGANLVHSEDGYTHFTWFTSDTQAGILKTLDALQNSSRSAQLASTTKHKDYFQHTIAHNGKTARTSSGYLRVANWQAKPGRGEDVENFFKKYIQPDLDAAVASGSVLMYNFDTETIHSDAPGGYFLAVAYANGEGLDKATAALAKHAKEDPAVGEGFGAMLETKDHRDQLARITGFQHK